MATGQPSMKRSDESTERQLTLAKRQGDALTAAILEMTQHEAHGREMRCGDYIVGVAVEHAEGLYHQKGGALEWIEPSEENAHVEVVVRDAADGRFIPNLDVRATVIAPDGAEVGTHPQPFLWHPWLYHYGRNWKVPGDGEYTIRIHVEPARFPRHDKVNGWRYTTPVDAEFPGVRIETGQKHS